MRACDVIKKKRDGNELSEAELRFFTEGYTSGEIPDYQAAAFLVAVFLKGMTGRETANFTLAMADSGRQLELSGIDGIKVDKHSSGGVGDKTTLIAVPIAAACGVKSAKMSGRGLGHTGGTADKLKSIPGFDEELSESELISAVNDVGFALVTQTNGLCPADKKFYALRDATGTVESIPLIASSIMSKKLASGCDRILLDVKCGSGAFMKNRREAEALAAAMVEIGENLGRKTAALITDMDFPLGRNIGNALEVIEAAEVLRGLVKGRLRELCLELAAGMILLGEKAAGIDAARAAAQEALDSGRAFQRLCECVGRQGGDVSVLTDTSLMKLSRQQRVIRAEEDGFFSALDAEAVGRACVLLGAGRETKESAIDLGAGIRLFKERGDALCAGEAVMELYSEKTSGLDEAEELLSAQLKISAERPKEIPVVLERVGI